MEEGEEEEEEGVEVNEGFLSVRCKDEVEVATYRITIFRPN